MCVQATFFFHKLKKKHTKPTKTLLTNLEKKRKSREREGKKFGDLVRLGQVKYKSGSKLDG